LNTPARIPLIIAHRGASGYLPEHSLAAKALAHGMGADYLEQDIVASRDGALLILHDLWLDDVSDVAERFPQRMRDDGHFYCIDFDLAEIRTLRFGERINPVTGVEKYPNRFPRSAGTFGVVTLDEEIRLIRGLNSSTGRQVGIYPEIKSPEWHTKQGLDLPSLVIDALDQHGYLEEGSRIFLQCFDADTLKKIRQRSGPDLPIIQLLSSGTSVDESLLREISDYADGIGPSIKLILRAFNTDGHHDVSDLVSMAQAVGLQVHPYTFRLDDLPQNCDSLDSLLQIFIDQLGVDGVFTDFTDLVTKFIRH
jgi:glycerophosphoryl diester phosphodiesterase